jgi:hypothetical protein
MTPDQGEEILRLREAKVAPKQIARKLSLRPAEVKAFIRDNSEALVLKKAQEGTLQPIHECLVNRSAAQCLLNGDSLAMDEGVGGMAQVLVARQDGDRIVPCSYLVDYWCLGVKDVIPPDHMSSSRYQRFRQSFFEQFNEPFVDITLQQAQSIVYGAVDYARSLGLEPARDFDRKAEIHLGLRPETLIPIEFGKDGQPFYFAGPYDDADQIIKTLNANVGNENYQYVMPIAPMGGDLGLLE